LQPSSPARLIGTFIPSDIQKKGPCIRIYFSFRNVISQASAGFDLYFPFKCFYPLVLLASTSFLNISGLFHTLNLLLAPFRFCSYNFIRAESMLWIFSLTSSLEIQNITIALSKMPKLVKSPILLKNSFPYDFFCAPLSGHLLELSLIFLPKSSSAGIPASNHLS